MRDNYSTVSVVFSQALIQFNPSTTKQTYMTLNYFVLSFITTDMCYHDMT